MCRVVIQREYFAFLMEKRPMVWQEPGHKTSSHVQAHKTL